MYLFEASLQLGVVILFCIGRSPNKNVQKAVIKEAAVSRDIIQQDFWDVYETLTYKVPTTVSAFSNLSKSKQNKKNSV